VDLQVVAPLLHQVFGKSHSGPVELAVAHVALPKVKDFPNKVIFEEFHAGEYVEHGALEGPLGKGQELSRDYLLVAFLIGSSGVVLADLDHTLVADSEVLRVEQLGVGHNF